MYCAKAYAVGLYLSISGHLVLTPSGSRLTISIPVTVLNSIDSRSLFLLYSMLLHSTLIFSMFSFLLNCLTSSVVVLNKYVAASIVDISSSFIISRSSISCWLDTVVKIAGTFSTGDDSLVPVNGLHLRHLTINLMTSMVTLKLSLKLYLVGMTMY